MSSSDRESNMVQPSIGEIEEFLLQNLTALETTLAEAAKATRQRWGADPKPEKVMISEAVWNLVAKGLVYIDSSLPDDPTSNLGAAHWDLHLTERGRMLGANTLPNPDLRDRYLQEFAQSVPDASKVVHEYLNEALVAYESMCYKASAVMVGVAAEAAFLEMLKSFSKVIGPEKSKKFFPGPGKHVPALKTQFDTFRKEFDIYKKEVRFRALADGLEIQLDANIDLIRRYRNDSGHPTGIHINRAACHTILVTFVGIAGRLCDLKAAFESEAQDE